MVRRQIWRVGEKKVGPRLANEGAVPGTCAGASGAWCEKDAAGMETLACTFRVAVGGIDTR